MIAGFVLADSDGVYRDGKIYAGSLILFRCFFVVVLNHYREFLLKNPMLFPHSPPPPHVLVRGQHGLIPLLCDMLLDARCGDTGLWSPILADACRYPDLCRVLILRVYPRLARSVVADAFACSASLLAPSWEEVSFNDQPAEAGIFYCPGPRCGG